MKHLFNLVLISSGILFLSSCNTSKETSPIRKDIIDAVFASGTMIYDKEYTVTAYSDGYLTTSVDEGDSVKHGELIFRIGNDIGESQIENTANRVKIFENKLAFNSPELVSVKEQIFQLHLKKSADSINLNRYKNLIEKNAVPRVDYEHVKMEYDIDISQIKLLENKLLERQQAFRQNTEDEQAQLKIQKIDNAYYNIKSVPPGIVLKRYKNNGEHVRKGDALAYIGSGILIARLLVSEEEINRIKINQSVTVSFNTSPDSLYMGRVTKIYPAFDKIEQAFLVDVSFDKILLTIRQGTQLQANIIISEKRRALVIPSSFLYPGDSVIVKETNKKTAIKTGIRTFDWTEVISGLKGDEVLKLDL